MVHIFEEISAAKPSTSTPPPEEPTMTDVTGPPTEPTLVDLDATGHGDVRGDGVHWSLEDDPQLNVNLVHLDGGSSIAAHVNDEVQVALVVLHGAGELHVDGVGYRLGVHTVAVVPLGRARAIVAGSAGLTYLTVHRRRGPLSIGAVRRDPGSTGAETAEDEGGDPPCWAHLVEDDATGPER